MAVNFNLPRSIPWTTSQVEPGTQARTLVDERFDSIAALVKDSRLDFASAIAAMNQSLSPIVVNELNIAGITVPDLGGDIPTFTGTFDKTFVATLDEFDVEYVEPDGKPDATLAEWEESPISLEPELINKLAFWLLSGESAIPNALAAEIYDAAVLRLDEERAQSVAKIESETAAKGWAIPGGVAFNQRVQIEREYGKGAVEISAKIAEKNMELIQANFHKAAEIALQYVVAGQDYIVKKNTAKIQWYTAAVDAWIKQVEAAIKVIDAKVAAFKGKVEAFEAKAMAYRTEAEVFDSSVKAYVALVDGLKARISAIAETVKMKVEVFKVESEAMIEEEKLKVQAQTATQSLAQRIAEAQSNLHAQMVASGLSALHVQAGISASHSTGQQVGFSYSYGEQMSEQHSESESINTEV